MTKFCYICERTLPYISEADFFADEAKHDLNTMIHGIRFETNPFAVELHEDTTKHWVCNRCWWIDWWEI